MREQIVRFEPAWDKRPSSGIHGVELRMLLRGPEGAVQFVLFTDWYLPETKSHMLGPFPADLGYHSFTPRYEGQSIITDSCPYIDNKPCYYDGSGVNAERIFNVLIREGSGGVWRELNEYYDMTFDVKSQKEEND